MTTKEHRLSIRVDQKTYNLLQTQAARRGESMSRVARRILQNNLQSEAAVDSQEVLLSVVRTAIAKELRRSENRLASISSKAAISAAATENLMVYMLKIMNEPNFKAIRGECRKRGVAYVREPLEQIMQAYGEHKERGDDN
ncbi:MAG TPA: hypothetical protein DD791_09795 [Syntrophomonas sp.]|mgnify:CR=1 FL=1|nr:hypothetical protein [Syntrophomonas sp.]